MILELALLAFWKILLTSEGHFAADKLTCVTDYWLNVACNIDVTDNRPVGVENIPSWLEFYNTVDGQTYKCPLVEMVSSYGCRFWAKYTEFIKSFADYDEFTVRLCYDIDCQSNFADLPIFRPYQKIQLTAPYNLTVQFTTEGYNVTWQSGYENHLYIADKIYYHLCLYNMYNETVFNVTADFNNTSTSIGGSTLYPDTKYFLKIRSKIKPSEIYDGQWSSWSASVGFKTVAKEAKPNILIGLFQFAFPVCVVAGVLLFVINNLTTRMKIRALKDVPTPAPFFKPLNEDYNGRFQDWLVSECNLTPWFEAEDFMTVDTLIVEAKPIAADQEVSGKNTHPLANDHTAYVPSLMDWVSRHSPNGNGLEDIPYTQLPRSPLELEFGRNATSLSQDSIVGCDRDSGCEDLTLSPDARLPNSPVSSEPMSNHADEVPFAKSLNVSSPQFIICAVVSHGENNCVMEES